MSVGPKICSVGVPCATARCNGPLSTPSTMLARFNIAASCPTVASVISNGVAVILCAISSSIGSSDTLPVMTIRTEHVLLSVSAVLAHASVRHSLTAAPVPA